MRRTAAEIAAAAVYELYPDVELLGARATSVGFMYDFVFPHPIHPHLIEEKMRQIVREKRPIRTLEMVPFSASELLKSQGHFIRSEELAETQLVEIVQIGSFHDLSPGPHLKNTAELAAFKIKAEPLPEKGMRLTGWCHRSKDDLKRFLKQLDRYVDPICLGETQGYWKGDVWLEGGLRKREKLIQFFRGQLFCGTLEISSSWNGDCFDSHRAQGVAKVAEIRSSGHRETWIQVSFFGLPEKEMNSSLHLIGKTLTILGFEHSISPKGFVTGLVTIDGIGRSQELARVERRGDDWMITVHVEQVLNQMIEKNLWVKLENQ